MAGAKRGEKCALFLFDESEESYIGRSEGLGLDMRAEVEAGRIELRHLDPAELSVGEIADLVMDRVETQGVKLVVIDTLNGYLQSAMEEPSVILHIRELLSYLSRRQIVTIMTLTQHGIFGTELSSPLDFSFLADNVFLLRFFELSGALHKALSIVKKRSGQHEHTIRKLTMKAGGVDVSEPLTGFTGVLTGTPVYHPESIVPIP
jgi:circadian clock protein KaiC